ncbi:MAG: aminodeoxychorismate synthase component I [Coleofasciculaceae cyanobacterium SM2_3_26]|nr:aminodeoxychorismate synthase component I [Coleofasciculaceae cyanobacterium SM2_3_26]
MKTLIIDNYDSYTFNLYQAIAQINQERPIAIRNDEITWQQFQQLEFDNVVISPGPGRPECDRDFGICLQAIREIQVPLLGVCLGHQGIGYGYGGTVTHAPEVKHGQLSPIYHNGCGLFDAIPSPFKAVRYHSLIVTEPLPACLEVIARTADGLVMGLRHRQKPLWGVQFHPESICTECGYQLLDNFRKLTQKFIEITGRRSPTRSIRKLDTATRSKTTAIANSPPKISNDLHNHIQVLSRKLQKFPNPEQVFFHLFGRETHTFWLDSSQIAPGLSRFSFMGADNGIDSFLVSYRTQDCELTITKSGKATRSQESIFDFLKREGDRNFCKSEELPFEFNCGFVGYFGYELKAECGANLVHPSPLPDAMFLFADRLLAFDHQEQTVYLVCLARQGQRAEATAWFDRLEQQLSELPPLPEVSVAEKLRSPITFHLRRSRQTYLENIETCLNKIYEGESYEVCLTNQLYTNVTPDPLTFYRILRQQNPAPYSAFLRFGDVAIACSSPERFLRVDRSAWVETKPIKGTISRGETIEEDERLRQHLQHNEKERAENLMIVDLLRNDLGLTCEVGSIHVPKLMDVETYATVHQLVSTVRGKLRSPFQAIDCIQKAFPGGSMTGAPKLRTMEILDRLEEEARGVYSGAIGFLGLNGAADLNIVIRTALLTSKGTSIGVGGGIVALSDPDSEFEEILLKARASIRTLLLTIHGEVNEHLYSMRLDG